MQIDPPQRGDDKYKKKKKKQRPRSEEADLSRQRPRLQLLRHGDSDSVSRNQIRVIPGQIPAIADFVFRSRRKSIFGKVDVFEIGVNVQREVANLRNAVAEVVAPGVQSLRTIARVQDDCTPCRHPEALT